jgi:hypothetical protein
MSNKHFTYTEQAECVRREIKQRGRVYPRLVENGKMTPQQMQRELACMAAVLLTIEELAKSERLL